MPRGLAEPISVLRARGRQLLGATSGDGVSSIMAVTGLPQNYEDLVVEWIGRSTGTPISVYAYFEASPTNIYNWQYSLAQNATISGSETFNTNSIYVGAVSAAGTLMGGGRFRVNGYARTDRTKAFHGQSGYFGLSGANNLFSINSMGLEYSLAALGAVYLGLASGQAWGTESRLAVWGER